LKDFKENFSIYRGKIKAFSKMLNNLHLNILAMFSDINRTNYLENTPSAAQSVHEMLVNVFQDIKSFYRETNNNKKRIEDFKQNKYQEIEIHELITRIIYNLSKVKEIHVLICAEKSITLDIFEYLIKFSNIKKDNFIKSLLDSKRKKNPEEVKKFLLSITDNTLGCFRNIFLNVMEISGLSSRGNKNSIEKFHCFLTCIEEKFTNMGQWESIMMSLEATLKENGITSTKFTSFKNEIKQNLSKFWDEN
jgi:hypothetical protein